MSQGPHGRFVPSGVNEQSWLGFEQRIQERRFQALLESMNHAIARGEAIDARVALEEARELRPEAPELAVIEERLASIPILAASEPAGSIFKSRTFGAVMLLLVGVTLVITLERLRSADPQPPVAAVVTVPESATAIPVAPIPVTAPSQPEQVPVTIVPPPAADQLATPEAIGTSGMDRAIRSTPPPVMRQPSFRAASTAAPAALEPRPQPQPQPFGGETPDDFVFTPPPAPRPQNAGSSAVAAGAQQVAAIAPSAAGPRPSSPAGNAGNAGNAALAASSAASAIAPRLTSGDQTRVADVLNQYARAYGQLDAVAAREVWPTVNERALARAFAGLSSQDVAFDDCEIDVRGAKANASCRGKASYVGKIGSGEQRTEARTWRFELRRDGEAWKIENAEARRQ
jgi:hypothetical protein